ncbi:hypothetical protein CcI49_20195 [Frankia sp. CcI49]|uniref:enoyl-CoA hydratase/isomerase family protein n=1 Tax=Frankia sp. CcI49 TaxID=1745382 RepID=UPI0009773594|nr:enoyl-CoA hydratase/isomerase family protein [Frankia sp. CcI49]ONH58752.1 hypothetical protein CcI49_20195 [Frankia sp. CcI49]
MLTLAVDGPLATVTLDRPPVNAWDDDALDRLDAITARLAASPQVRLAVVRSAGRHFSAGGDIAMMAAAVDSGDVTALNRFAGRIQHAFTLWAELPVPTLAVLRGAVTGGGLEFALACDLRIAAEGSRIGLPESQLGLVAAGGGTQRLTAAIGRGAAMRIMLTAELVDGRRAAELGIVEWCVPDADLDAEVDAVTARILAGSAAAQRAAKECVARAGTAAGFAAETVSQRRLHADPDTQNRLRRFLHDRRTQHGRTQHGRTQSSRTQNTETKEIDT